MTLDTPQEPSRCTESPDAERLAEIRALAMTYHSQSPLNVVLRLLDAATPRPEGPQLAGEYPSSGAAGFPGSSGAHNGNWVDATVQGPVPHATRPSAPDTSEERVALAKQAVTNEAGSRLCEWRMEVYRQCPRDGDPGTPCLCENVARAALSAIDRRNDVPKAGEDLRAELLALANAADDVGVGFFDTDDLPPEVDAMQKATLAARAALERKEGTQGG